MAQLNIFQEIEGDVPTLGYQLNVDWKWVISLSAGVAAVHVLLVGLILFISRPIVVADDSNLVTARLLHGLVDRLGEKGGLLDGREIAKAVEQEGRKGGDGGRGREKVGYGVREGITEGTSTGCVLEISSAVEVRKSFTKGRFPRGRYI